MIVVYGLKSCDRCRDARNYLTEHKLEHKFHDLHSDGLTPTMLKKWVDRLGWESLLNRRGTTWRHLPKQEKADLNREKAERLILEYPAVIKRPVMELDEKEVFIGFEQPHRDYLSNLASATA